MRRLFTCVLLLCTFHSTYAQNVLSLAQCRELALQNNRQLKISKMTADVAENTHKAAKCRF